MQTRIYAIVIGLVFFINGISTQAGEVTVKGSDTMVILAQKWAETYMIDHPKTMIRVTGGGTGTGLAALQNETTTLCNASRKIKTKEKEACVIKFGKLPKEYAVAMDGLAVYVNDKNPVNELTLDQIKNIFIGKIKNWKEVGGDDAPILAYSRENSSGTYEFFKELVLQGGDFAAHIQTLPGTAALLQSVGRDNHGIGYGGIAYGAGAKHLKVKKDANSPAIEPSQSNVHNETYPIWRYLYIYVNPALDKGETSDYLKWITSPTGQAVVKDVGYFPLPSKTQK